MEKHEDVVSILSMLELDDIEEKISQPYHESGPGRPPRSPLGIFKALMVKRLRRIARARKVASANENEKKHALGLVDKASRVVVDGFDAVVADSQYSSRRVRSYIREHGARPVIPYPSNQRRGEEVLRVDRLFRTSGPCEERRVYGVGRASVERVNSRLEMVGLGCLKLRGLRNVMVHVLLCVITVLLVAVAAIRLGRPWKARSLASFWW